MDGKRSNLLKPETSNGTLEYPKESFLIMEGGPVVMPCSLLKTNSSPGFRPVNSKGMDGKRSNELGPTGPGPV
jgi:hypothetical protein